ncbi:MAG TPA: efflux RND transporter periplasmic adaptor subunit [Acidobacteriaceae bacterium]|nr:efflux RND transporter periplasmic adaptor subunit [Acidobacteriaceae bacterium]
MTTSLRRVPVTLLSLALLASLAGCSKDKEAEAAPVAVEAAPAKIAPIAEHVVADAVLAPIAQAAISPKITAPVKKFYVRRGARVKAGELLATLENNDLEAAVTDNRGAYDAANAAYQMAVKAQVPEELQKAQLDYAQAKANLDLNKSIVESREKLFAEGAISGRDLDTSKAALVQAQAAYDAANQHLLSMRQVSHEAALKAAKGDLESARGKYEGAQAQLSYSEIRSPIAGVVTDRPLYEGETVVPGSPLITVMDTSALLARIHLSQLQAQLLKAGDAASLAVPGLSGPVDGKITLVSPATDPGSTTIEVWVRVENRKGTLRPGTAVHVTLNGRALPNALVVPSEAIVINTSGKPTVMAVGSDGIAHQTSVETGIVGDDTTQILSGLSAGQQVVTVGAASLDDGTHVKISAVADDDKAAAGEAQGKDDEP